MNKDKYQRSYVIVNGEKVDTNDIEVLDVSEDISGRDILSFIYNGERYTSFVITTR
jgi:hypothetical protein